MGIETMAETSGREGVDSHVVPDVRSVGHYDVMPEVAVHLPRKPALWHRFWTRVFFGWRWYDDPA